MRSSPHSQIIVADVLDGLAQIPSESVQCVLTSPPYQIQGKDYVGWLSDVSCEIQRVMRLDGVMFLILGNSYGEDVDEMPWRVLSELWTWHLRSDFIWHNDIQHDYIFLLSAGPEFYYGGSLRRRAIRPKLFTYSSDPQPFRFPYRAFPVELARELVELGSRPGDTVLDPFSGSGSTGVAALGLGRNYIGIEIDAETAEKSKSRLAAAHTQP